MVPPPVPSLAEAATQMLPSPYTIEEGKRIGRVTSTTGSTGAGGDSAGCTGRSTDRSSPRNARATRTAPAAARTRATAPAASRRPAPASGSGRGSRVSMSGHRSGPRTLSSRRNFVSRSAIVASHEVAEPPPALAQVDPYRGRRRTNDRGHLTDRVTGAVVQNHRGPLLRRQAPKRLDQLHRLRVHPVPLLSKREILPGPPGLQISPGDPERRPPDPPIRLPDLVTSPQRLGERLGHRVGGHLGVPGERQNRSPQAIPVLPVHPLQAGGRPHRRFTHTLL